MIDSIPIAIQNIVKMVRSKGAACLVWLAFGMAAVGASPVDKSKPYGQVCIGVVTGDKEQPLHAHSEPGANTYIVAHAEANERCQLLIFALNGDGTLAHDWRPQLVELGESDQIQLPETPVVWKWSEASEPFSIYVLFLHPNFKDSRELKTLVKAMLNAGDRDLLHRQSVKLRELATRSGSRQGEVIHVAKIDRFQVAATYRGPNFPWHDHASGVNFSEAKPGLLMFVLGKSGPSDRESGSSR